MIIENRDEIASIQRAVATLKPCGDFEFEGAVAVNGETLNVKIERKTDFSRRAIPHMEVRVPVLPHAPKSRIESYALQVAKHQLEDAAWLPLKVDLRDGETTYSRVWTYAYPDDDALHAFLDEAQRFLDTHRDDVIDAAYTDGEGDSRNDEHSIEDVLSLF